MAMNTAIRPARGIVADSKPAAEHDEVLAKSAALLRALKLAEAGL